MSLSEPIPYIKNSGPRNDRYCPCIGSDEIVSEHPYSIPPHVPEQRVRTLQKAFISTLRNPELLAEAEKATLEIDPIDGPGIGKIVNGLYEIEPAVVSRVRQILESRRTIGN